MDGGGEEGLGLAGGFRVTDSLERFVFGARSGLGVAVGVGGKPGTFCI